MEDKEFLNNEKNSITTKEKVAYFDDMKTKNSFHQKHN